MKNTLAVRLVFLFVAYLLTKCDSYQSSDEDGGWQPLDPNSEEARRIAQAGLEYFVRNNSDINRPPNTIVRVTYAASQIVAGQNYRVNFDAVYTENGNNFDDWSCNTEAYEDLDGNVEIQESTCEVFTQVHA